MTQLSLFLDVILIAGLFTVGVIVYRILKHVGICVYWATHDSVYVLMNLRDDVTTLQVIKGVTKYYFKVLVTTHRNRLLGSERTT